MHIVDTQRNWTDIFERTDRQNRKRHELIDQVSTDARVKSLLHALTGHARARWFDGDEVVAIPVDQIAWKLEKSENTAKSYIDLALQTPFLEILPSRNQSHTYTIHWQAILGQESTRDADSTAREARQEQDADSTAETVSRGSTRGSTAPQIAPQLDPLLKTSEKPVLKEDFSKELVSKPVSAGGQLPPGRHNELPQPQDFWGYWMKAIASRDLGNPEHVEQLYRIAVQLGAVVDSEQNRFRVFCQAALNVRMRRSGDATTEAGLFKSNVASNRWFCTQADEETAREMLKRANLHVPCENLDDEKARLRKLLTEKYPTPVPT